MGCSYEIWCVTVLKRIGEKKGINLIKESLNEKGIRYAVENKIREKVKRKGFRRKI